ncbi:MAG: RIP metalloprotease RseP, partial [Chitinophagales bacterium]
MQYLSMGLQLFASLSILITLHELGHFLAAKYFKVRVEKFYLFFDFLFPFPEVANFALFKKKIGDTEYGIGWFPFGGYVQMSGIMDENMDKDELKKPVQDYEFRAKPAWQRLIILLGGIAANILVAFVLYSMIAFTWGDQYLPVENAKDGIYCDSLALSIGLENGDHVLVVGETTMVAFSDIPRTMVLELADNVTVNRNGETLIIDGITEEFYGKLLNSESLGFITPAIACVIDSISPETALDAAGAMKGDKIISFDNKPIEFFQDLAEAKEGYANQSVEIEIERQGQLMSLSLELDETGMLGFTPLMDFDIAYKKYGFFASIAQGPIKTWKALSSYVKQFKLIFNSKVKGYEKIGGFGAISKMFDSGTGQFWNWSHFWRTTAMLSVILAFMNLLP